MPSGWASRLGESIEPGSWSECVDLLLSSGGDDALYRGQRRFDWELLASLERVLLDYTERYDKDRHELMMSTSADRATEKWVCGVELKMMQRFRQRAMHFAVPGLPEAWDILGWWELADAQALRASMHPRTVQARIPQRYRRAQLRRRSSSPRGRKRFAPGSSGARKLTPLAHRMTAEDSDRAL